MPLKGEAKKAYSREYLREYMRKKRLEKKQGLNTVLTEKPQISLRSDASQAKSREFESRLPLH
jgi:hypothetical protein